jgi:hypothetical protein
MKLASRNLKRRNGSPERKSDAVDALEHAAAGHFFDFIWAMRFFSSARIFASIAASGSCQLPPAARAK